ncbi:LLM class flavin-dependent oxidoreductase [Pseudonocardia broussonetiae]|uniref:LLM class flavin-dependent oxidoreductase n=1 Tax=Pseudonocardia broussonetiae TaxID=2736640 RepID=A0A6M6JS98_9PSEU|nr:LLM class flavin-dependent oxidoreductase [Pseudonocardia broussonetiae]QJY49897.1 LLM class flavin-dependent oxidoreductase [Pseudonocardia broussonetiae]
MSPFTEARLHLGVEIGGAGRHPGAARRGRLDAEALLDPAWSVGLVRTAAARGLDLVVLTGPFAGTADTPELDAVALAARIAPVVPGIGLVPQATVTRAEPVHLSTAIAALDLVSDGRAGWEPVVSGTGAAPSGREPAAPADLLWREAGEVVDVVARLGDSDPLTVVRADEPEALAVAARSADVVRIAAPDLATARDARRRVRDAVQDAGRRADDVTVLLDVEVHLAATRTLAEDSLRGLDAAAGPLAPSSVRVVGTSGALADVVERVLHLRAADGVTFVPLALPGDLRAVTSELVPLLAGRGLFRTGRPGERLRTRFGPGRPADRHAAVGSAS